LRKLAAPIDVEARPLRRRKPRSEAVRAHYPLAVASDIPSSVRIVGRAIWTIEKSSTITNCAATSSVRIRERRGDEAGFAIEIR